MRDDGLLREKMVLIESNRKIYLIMTPNESSSLELLCRSLCKNLIYSCQIGSPSPSFSILHQFNCYTLGVRENNSKRRYEKVGLLHMASTGLSGRISVC